MRAWTLTLAFRDGTKANYTMVAETLDQAIKEASENEGRKPVWATGQVVKQVGE